MQKLLLFFICVLANTVYAQPPNEKVSLNLKDATLTELVKTLESQSVYRFVYGENIQLTSPINIVVKELPILKILDDILSNEQITFEISGYHILLSQKKEKEPLAKSGKHTISGYITDNISGETLIGATVYCPETGEGAISNEFGFYSLTIAGGEINLRFSYIGYTTSVKTLFLEQDTNLNIRLDRNKQLKEVAVYGSIKETGIHATHMGAIDVPLHIMKSTPALLSEADIMKTIQMLPGVQAGTDGSAGIYVRGGGIDENLILLDGIPLYNVDHLFGFFSVFSPDAVKKVDFFKSSFPARFGGRLSSVVDVRTNDGDMHNYHGAIGVGLLSSKLQFEGPIVKGKTSFNVSGRRSYWDFVTKPFMKDDFKFGYYFYDINAKINHRFSDKNRLYVSLYTGKDKLDNEFKNLDSYSNSQDNIDMKWGNMLAAVRWNSQLSPKLFSNTTFAYTNYGFNVNTRIKELGANKKLENHYNSEYSSGIRDFTFNLDFDYYPSPKHHIKFGSGYLNHRFKPEVQSSRIKQKEDGLISDTTYSSMSNSRILSDEINVYAEDNFQLDKFKANVGFHFSLFSSPQKTYQSFQPRLSLRYQLADDWALKASYSKMSQYIHLLSSYTITMPSDLWVPATSKIKPMDAHQFSMGAYYTGINGWELSTEIYYKHFDNVLEYKDGASFIGTSQNWESKVEMEMGRAMGIEFMAQKSIGKMTGWLSYTLSKSERKFSKGGINNGNWFPYRYDRRHHISAIINYKFSEKIDIGASWEYYTGGVTTLAKQKTIVVIPDDKPSDPLDSFSPANYVESRNNYRMPSSHRFNIGINFNKKTKRGMGTWNLSVYNLYNAMNPTFIYRSSSNSMDPNEKIIVKKITILPFVPSVSYIYKF